MPANTEACHYNCRSRGSSPDKNLKPEFSVYEAEVLATTPRYKYSNILPLLATLHKLAHLNQISL